ncbi:MAG: T9SS type A sorting domain-containing protein [Flavobacterium sp. JAD_PAG50586_2]|nr:MAG: T9SS type A sorting domain-containing protein [Flavobacterium sp. JAD_PAG50586_2]
MKKNYTINSQILLSFLVLFTFSFSAFAQSRGGKGSQNVTVSKRVATNNIARNGTPNPIVFATDVVTACGSYTWPVNGQTYTASGIYTDGGGITQIFTDQTDWNNSATATGATVSTNNMANVIVTDPIVKTIGGITVTFTATGGMYSSGTFVGTANPNQNITITFSPAIYGISGNFFTTNVSDAVISGNVTATYSDGAIDSRTVTTNSEVFGYFSTTPITSLVLSTTTTVPNHFISLNNISIATNPTADDTLDLTIIPEVTPTFPTVNPICAGNPLSPLPTTSDNGITGVWSPALDNTTTTTYTFTPDAGQCATTKVITITVFPVAANSTSVTACNSYTWPITGTTYTTSGAYTATIPLTDTAVIDDVALWNQHASSFNSTIIFDNLVNLAATNPTILPMGGTTVTFSAPGGMYSGGSFIGTANPNNPLTIAFNPPVYGALANFFTTDINDDVVTGNITVNYSNGTSVSRSVTTDEENFGYFDNNLISNMVITSTTVDRYISVNNLRIATNPTSCSTETLNLTINTVPPPGSSIATAIDVNTPNYTTNGNNLETNCFVDNGGELSPDVWYKVTLDACAQTVSLNTCTGSNFDTILVVYAADGTTELAYSDDDCPDTNSFQSAINDLDVSGLDVIYVMVEGYFGLNNEQGNYGLEITQTLLTQEIPTFTAVADICNGDPLTALPTTSDNGIPGTWSPALDNTITTTYTFTPNADQCATTATLDINVNQPVTPTFTPVAAICNGDTLTALPTTSNNGFTGNWSPALDNTITTTYTFTPDAGQCAATTTLEIIVNQPVTPTFTPVAAICNGDTLTALPTTSDNGYTGTWSPALDNTTSTTYTFTPDAGQCATTTTLDIIVNQPITPTFTSVAAICNGDTLNALPTTSDNGYTGTWSPALNNTTTTTYTFTPDAGQCATTATLEIIVNQPITPTFTPVASICNGDTLNALPTTSNNGYIGTWSPAIDNTTTTTYTFTPDAGQCASTALLTIIVNQPVTPTFTAVTSICNGGPLSALPTTSNNGYTGIWSPALDNTTTTTYTFTPTAGQCATTASLTIIVNQPVTPTFAPVATICNGDALSALPTTSINGYTGTWSPALNNTATTTYTFTPTAGQCATTASLTITVNQPITPTFDPIATICNGDALTALPTTSNNGYNGTWSPALDNTTTATYTFTPTAGQCATTAFLTIIVNQPITPTFSAVASICNGDTLSALPTTSNNGYTGNWSPALDNTITTTYTFTPDAGQCAATASLTITVNQPVTPTFAVVPAICNGDSLSALPTTSVNGYTGTWSPALDNETTTTYTFTPTAGQCATTASLTITVNQPVIPTFSAIAPICNGDALGALPATSNNGYTGTWSPALNNTTTTNYTFTPTAGQCATTASLTITVNQPVTPTFNPIAPICNGDALTLPVNSTNGYSGTWSPTADNTATTTYTFTPNVGQCATTASLTITVNQPVTPIFSPVASICNGDALSTLPTTSNNGYTGTWSPALDNTATTTYTFTPTAGQCATTASLTISVNQPITPTFTAVAPICNGDVLSVLPTTSTNGYTGTWSPTLDNTATTTYTFTPDAGQCAAIASLTITVSQPVTPTFAAIAPICNGDALALPETSDNGITGTWSPALDNTTTTTYIFTPNAGQCATTASLTITVNQPITPTFVVLAPICNGDALVLPTTSDNSITGTWSPALDNTTTTTYTFTPDTGQCATTASLTVIVNQPVTPIFSPVTAICNGDALNALPTTSDNGYTGTWSPALDNTATTTYTFTPDTGQCATTASLTITVNQPITPTFTPVAAICNGDALSALPTTSNNGYTGTWSPALDNTATTTYTFSPDAGQCAIATSLTITVNQPITPTFTAVNPICTGDALSPLPTTSNNGYTGTWSPALDNTATTIYTFTPDAGQCAAIALLTITVNQVLVTPTFTSIAPICNGDILVLPTTSDNGFVGSWTPTVDNTTTTTYTFTPNPGQCGTTTTLTVTVNQPVTPTFTVIAPICNGDALVLPSTSDNGIPGTWSPAVDNTVTTTYTFTPNAGQCATTASLTVTVNQPITPTFSPVATICNGDTLSALPTTSNNGYTGTWSPALDNTATTVYTFTPDAGQCATTASLTITVNQPVTPTFTPVAAICNGDPLLALPTTSNNGISGTWSPALDNTATTIYTFTPDASQCAVTATMTITIQTTATPTGNPVQTFDVTDLNDATLEDLIVNPTDVNWYGSLLDAQSLNNPLPLSTVLTNGATYYAVAFSATCPSEPFAVTVNVNLANPSFEDLNFNYYPNPTSSVVNITCSRNITKVTLVTMLGQVIMTQDTDSTEVQVDLSRLAEATYFVKVISDDREKVIKVVKRR